MKYISKLIARIPDLVKSSSKVSLARTSEWVDSQIAIRLASEVDCEEARSECSNEGTTDGYQYRARSGRNLVIEYLLSNRLRRNDRTPLAETNEEGSEFEDGVCFAIDCEYCGPQSSEEQLLARIEGTYRLQFRTGFQRGESERRLAEDTGGIGNSQSGNTSWIEQEREGEGDCLPERTKKRRDKFTSGWEKLCSHVQSSTRRLSSLLLRKKPNSFLSQNAEFDAVAEQPPMYDTLNEATAISQGRR